MPVAATSVAGSPLLSTPSGAAFFDGTPMVRMWSPTANAGAGLTGQSISVTILNGFHDISAWLRMWPANAGRRVLFGHRFGHIGFDDSKFIMNIKML